MLRVIHNVETGEIVQVQLTEPEIKQLENEQAEIEKKQIARQAEAQTKATARATILDRLGLTEEEATVLFS